MKKNKLKTTIFLLTLLSLTQINTTFATTISLNTRVHEFNFITNQHKQCEKCNLTIPVNMECPSCSSKIVK